MNVRTGCLVFALLGLAGCGVPDSDRADVSGEAVRADRADPTAAAHDAAAPHREAGHAADTAHEAVRGRAFPPSGS